MASSNNVENLSPQTIRNVMREMTKLVEDPPEGIKVTFNEQDVTDIQAVIAGPAGTPYAGGSFRVKLVLGKNFPTVPPKGFFITKIFHPNVSETGEICVNTLKRDWTPDLGLRHIFLVIKCLLIVPNAESALNDEAGKLIIENYSDYEKRAKMMTEIHAQDSKNRKEKVSEEGDNSEPQNKKQAVDKKEKKKLKEKKRALKRL